jgi:hypothetical protein
MAGSTVLQVGFKLLAAFLVGFALLLVGGFYDRRQAGEARGGPDCPSLIEHPVWPTVKK